MLSFDFILLLSALGFTALSVYLFTSAVMSNNQDADALAWASGDEPSKSKSGIINFSRPLVHNFTLQHAAKIKNPRYRKRVEKKILTAGLASELNVDEFIGLQVLWGILFPIAFVFMNFGLRLGYPYPFAFAIAAFGAYFPHFYCVRAAQERYREVVTDMPFFIDLLALCTEANLDFIGAISRIVEKADDGVLANEFRQVLNDIKLGSSRADALKRLAQRLDISEMTSFCAVIIDADQNGAPIAGVLKDQSEQIRSNRFSRAEKEGAKASQAIFIPMMFLIFPAIFIILFAPPILQMFYGGTP